MEIRKHTTIVPFAEKLLSISVEISSTPVEPGLLIMVEKK